MVYVSDSLQNIPQNKYLTKRYAEITGFIKQDERSGDEIAAKVITDLDLRV